MKKIVFLAFLSCGGLLSVNVHAGFFDTLIGNQSKSPAPAPQPKATVQQSPPAQTVKPAATSGVIAPLNTMDGTQILTRSEYCVLPQSLANDMATTTAVLLCDGIDTTNPQDLQLYYCHQNQTTVAISTIFNFINQRNECRDSRGLTGYSDYVLRCGNPTESYDNNTPREEVVRIWRQMGCDCIEDLKKFYRQRLSACSAAPALTPTTPSITPSGPANPTGKMP